jgi:ribonuclease HII
VLIYAGIDEAGYGPMLGPLCVAGTVFVLADHDPAGGQPELWRLLRTAVCRKPSDRRRRIAVDDSKKLKGANDGPSHPLRHLERAVLAFHPHGDTPPETDAQLFAPLGAEVPGHAWFAGDTALPLAHTPDQLRISRGRVQRAMQRAAVGCKAMWCRVIDAEELNRSVTDQGTKADVNFDAAVRLIEAAWSRWPDEHPRIIIDRHGGRTRYAEGLQRALAGTTVDVVAETATMSRYTLSRAGSKVTVSFATEADGRFLPVALASMLAKYVRELLMIRFNRFFREQMPDLKPTAGYFTDGRRYLTEIKPLMKRLDVTASQLVRRV